MCVCVRVYVCMYVRMYACMYVAKKASFATYIGLIWHLRKATMRTRAPAPDFTTVFTRDFTTVFARDFTTVFTTVFARDFTTVFIAHSLLQRHSETCRYPYVSTETNVYGKRDLSIWQKRPVYMAKEKEGYHY